jgi:hypothetical protein
MEFWNYYGIVGIMIMLLTLVVMICEYVDRDEKAVSLKCSNLTENWGVLCRFKYRHRWVQILACICVAISIILILIVSAGPYYDKVHQSLKAPFAYTYVLLVTVVFTYLWMLIVRTLKFLLLMLAYVLFWCYCWVLGFDTTKI